MKIAELKLLEDKAERLWEKLSSVKDLKERNKLMDKIRDLYDQMSQAKKP